MKITQQALVLADELAMYYGVQPPPHMVQSAVETLRELSRTLESAWFTEDGVAITSTDQLIWTWCTDGEFVSVMQILVSQLYYFPPDMGACRKCWATKHNAENAAKKARA